MGKTFHFLAGLHRSGNTVLSSILNQHPDIYSSPISSLIDHIWNFNVVLQNNESIRASNLDKERTIKTVSKIPEIYYEDINKTIIFDRSKSWTNPDNIDAIRTCLNKTPKIVFTTRPILECVASYIAIQKNVLIDNMNKSDYIKNTKLNENDNIAEYLISEHSHFGITRLWAMQSLDNPDYNGIIHVVKYQDLLNAHQKTMNTLYNFLEIEQFDHNFKNIRKIEEYNDSDIGLSKDLHKVRRILGKSDVRVEDYLSPYIIEKYKDLRYF